MMKTHKIVSCVVCFFCWFSTFCLVTVPTPIFSVGSLIKNLPVIYPPSTVCGDNMSDHAHRHKDEDNTTDKRQLHFPS